MLIGGCTYAYLIGDICSVLSNTDPATSEYQSTMDMLNQYMDEIKLPTTLRTSLREYFVHCRPLYRQAFYHDLLNKMSPKLRGDVALHNNAAWIERIPFFVSSDRIEKEEFITAVSMKLT